ncbi:MAG TPA: aldolase/citrate lyase family protein [Tepidisphaeraceae bacterium]|nr:aldolase/citrate lyase family protein [Tepidisphaeraceae bacterium]
MRQLRSICMDGIPQLGLAITYPSPGIVERIGADWDWIWIDGQHGEIGYNDILGLVRACDLIQRPAIVRVPGHEFGPIGMALDTAAAGLIVPCIDTPEQAKRVVNAAKFPPLGKRSYGGRRVGDLRGRNYSDDANDSVLLIAQIESPEAIENVDEIAAIPGIDALFLGPDDMLLRRGVAMTAIRNRDTLGKDMEAVVNACRAHSKLSVMVGVGQEMLNTCLSMGFHMVVCGGDVLFLASSSKQLATEARKSVKDSMKLAPSVAIDHPRVRQGAESIY